MKPQRACKQCSVLFNPTNKHPHKVFCSRGCLHKARRKLTTIYCKVCNTLFMQRAMSSKTCSAACAGVLWGWRKGKKFTKYTLKCKVCGKEFDTVPTSSKKHTCSYLCAGIYKRKKLEEKTCMYCSKVFITKRSDQLYCSHTCRGRNKSKESLKNSNLVKNLRTTLRPYIKSEKGNKCEQCGWAVNTGVLEIHHIDRNTNNNHKDNLVLLCPNCHSIEHYNAKDGNYSFKS